MDVRLARASDLSKLVALGPHFASQMPYQTAGVDASSVLRMLRSSLAQGLLIIAGDGVGGLLGLKMPLWFDPKTVIAVELAWWLEPEYRSGTVGIRMIDLFEKSAKQAGCHHVSMMLMQNIQPDRVAALYERRGYHLTERVFVKELACLE